ncbi:MAG: 30S ribosomal protein S8 [Patescibacteria group bacterium]|jgi:small subunit ribosomal protein S8
MTVSDNLGDMLTQVKNAYMANKRVIVLEFSKEKESALKVLEKRHVVEKVEIIEADGEFKKMSVTIPPRTDLLIIKRMSKPGRRMYVKSKDIYNVKGGKGFLIISTSQGIMDSTDARKSKLGGELVAEVF